MFKNFLLLAYRNFIKSPLTSFIELFGMTIGLTVFLLVLLWLFHETSYDKFNEHADRTYRLEVSADNEANSALITSIISPLLKENLPEIESVTRFRYFGSGKKVYILDDKNEKQYFSAGPSLFADNGFFETFSFEFVAGNPETALTQKNSVVITESMAKTIFGNKNAVGEMINNSNRVFTITGVIKDVPNFHIPFNMLRSFASLEDHYINIGLDGLDIWGFSVHLTYLTIKENQDIGQLEKKINSLIKAHRPEKNENFISNQKFYLRPLEDVYFNGGIATEEGYSKHGDRKKVIAYGSIAIFTLLLACINFINLNSAKSLERAKEVGIKKVSGASRAGIFIQFLGEVIILCNIALVFALLLTAAILPQFSMLMGTSLSMGQLLNPTVFIAMVIGLFLISLISGGFPALYLSSFHPVRVMKGLPVSGVRKIDFKKVNIMIQFAITIILLIGSITIFRQIDYMKNADLGFNKENQIVFDLNIEQYGDKVEVIKRRLLENRNIHHVTHTQAVPGRNTIADQDAFTLLYKGVEYNLTGALVDEDYQKTLGLEMVEGRFFEKEKDYDHFHRMDNEEDWKVMRSIVLNETAVKTLGLEQPIGAILKLKGYNEVKVIGVIKDFHLNSFNNKILPMYFISRDRRYQMIVNISSNDTASTLQFVITEMEKITGVKPDIRFLGEEFNNQYGDDQNFAKLIGYFTFLAIFIASMGLFGVSIYTIKLRLKEIGIRKALGASSFQILILLLRSFINIVIVSALVAIPIAWSAMNSWLGNYAYHTNLPSWVFLVGFGIAVIIALATILRQSWIASNQNPAKLIKYE